MSVATTVIDVESEAPEPSLAEQVAQTITGIDTIGQARRILEAAGWQANIVANHITVDHKVIADYVSVNGSSWWQVYTLDGTPPVFVTGAQNTPVNWIGAVE